MRKKEVILGIGGFTAHASACLIADGEILGAMEEERLSRKKHEGGWAKESIRWVLKEYGVRETDITHISFSYDPWLRITKRIPYRLRFLFEKPLLTPYILFYELRSVSEFLIRLKRLREKTGARLHYVRHHLAHAASAFFTSPYSESAFYTADQRGEWDTTLLGKGEDTKLRILGNTTYPHSLGIFYAGVTQHLGFGRNDDYKVMGLAAYGNPQYADKMRKVIFPVEGCKFKIDTSYLSYHKTRGFLGGTYFTEKFFKDFGPERCEDEPITQHHMDIAASAQQVFEEIVLHQLNWLHEKTQSENLSIAGGCGLNGAMNGKIYGRTPFKHVFLSSVSGDNGLSMGGALYVRHHLLGQKRTAPLLRSDLGSEYSNEEIRECLELYKLPYDECDDVVPAAVELLTKGSIVGWFQGRMEYGARALGHRTILANPTLSDMKDKINKYVKFREEFRPFAPSVLEEAAEKYFEIHDPIPFMTVVCPVKEEGIRKLPATTHVDQTARVQTVNRNEQPLYWRLIDEFGKRSGVPVLLNTSFNVMGEPIVEHPRQAISCLFSTGMDALVIGNFILKKESLRTADRERSEAGLAV